MVLLQTKVSAERLLFLEALDMVRNSDVIVLRHCHQHKFSFQCKAALLNEKSVEAIEVCK